VILEFPLDSDDLPAELPYEEDDDAPLFELPPPEEDNDSTFV